MKLSRSLLLACVCLAVSLFVPVSDALSEDWETISGNVTYDGSPVCSMVLANGQYMFTSSEDGSFDFDAPLDSNGQITVFTFCSGLAPYKQVVGQGQAENMQIAMESGDEGQGMHISCTLEWANSNWVTITGNVTYDGMPVCAMVLANGAYMFTCSGDGSYIMDVPLDEMGNITLFGFCEGLPPYQQIYNESQVNIRNPDIEGLWHGTFTEQGYGTYNLDGIAYDGDFIGISQDAGVIYRGTYFADGNNFIASVTDYEIDGWIFGTTMISGTFSEQNAIQANFTTSYGTSGSMSLWFDKNFNRNSSLDLIKGTYLGNTETVHIGQNGVLTGYNCWGCKYSGKISILNPNKNIYAVDVNVSSCGYDDGVYSGYLCLADTYSMNDTLLGAIYDQDFVGIWSLQKNP